MRVLCVGNLYPPHHLGGCELVWQGAVQAVRAAGRGVRVLTTDVRFPGVDAAGEDDDEVFCELRWYRRDHRFPRLSPWTRRRAFAAAGDRGATEVAPSEIDPAFLAPAPVREWGWRLLCVGRLDPRKGVDTAVEALTVLDAAATLVLAGGGDAAYERRLRARISEVGVGGRVELPGGVGRSRLLELYAAADALVFSVVWEEPWGLVPLEAMGRGVPVVATGRGGSGEYLREGENCLLFAAGDAGVLAGALQRLADDPGMRARLRDGGLATASQHTAPRFEARVVAVLKEVAGG